MRKVKIVERKKPRIERRNNIKKKGIKNIFKKLCKILVGSIIILACIIELFYKLLKVILKTIYKHKFIVLILIIILTQIITQYNYNRLNNSVSNLQQEVNTYKDEVNSYKDEISTYQEDINGRFNSINVKVDENVNNINAKLDEANKNINEAKERQVSSRSMPEGRESNSKNVSNTFTAKLTSYYTGDGFETGSKTGSGKSTSDFQVNEKGWYTYQGKLVLAAATNALLKSGYSVNGGNVRQEGKHYFNYYDEVIVTINGVDYQGIILDSCGAAMWEGKTIVDLFVTGSSSVVTTNVTIKVLN